MLARQKESSGVKLKDVDLGIGRVGRAGEVLVLSKVSPGKCGCVWMGWPWVASRDDVSTIEARLEEETQQDGIKKMNRKEYQEVKWRVARCFRLRRLSSRRNLKCLLGSKPKGVSPLWFILFLPLTLTWNAIPWLIKSHSRNLYKPGKHL